MNRTALLEPIDIGPDYRQRYLAALRSGRDQFACNVSGYSFERIRMDRAKLRAGYDVFAAVDSSIPKPKADIPNSKTPRASGRRWGMRAATAEDKQWAANIDARMSFCGMKNIQLSRATGYSQSWISYARFALFSINKERRPIVEAAVKVYEDRRAGSRAAA